MPPLFKLDQKVNVDVSSYNRWRRAVSFNPFRLRQSDLPAKIIGKHWNVEWGDCVRLASMDAVFTCPVRFLEEIK